MSEIVIVQLESIEGSVNTHIKVYTEEFMAAKRNSTKRKDILMKMQGLSSFIATLSLSLGRQNPSAFKKLVEIEQNILENIEKLLVK